jgi:hypothetical protein
MWDTNDNGQFEGNLMIDQVECGSEHILCWIQNVKGKAIPNTNQDVPFLH